MNKQDIKDTLVACIGGWGGAMALYLTGFPTWVAGLFK